MRKVQFKPLFASLGFLGLLLFSFQQCAEYGFIAKKTISASDLEGTSYSVLPPPRPKVPTIRVMFFVDQSFSMLQGHCPGDVDGAGDLSLEGNTLGCTPTAGIDPDAHRFAVIRKWLDDLKVHDRIGADVKVALVPFSGGKYQRPRNDGTVNYDGLHIGFKDLDNAYSYLDKLVAEHESDKLNLITSIPMAQNASESEYLGTSVPYPALQNARALLTNELEYLQNNDLLDGTPFYFVYLSDGVFKPLTPHLHRVLEGAGCPISCQADPSHWVCGPNDGYTGENPRTLCTATIPNEFRNVFGDPMENRFDLLAEAITEISKTQNTYETVDFQSHLVQLYPDRIDSSNLNVPGETYMGLSLFRNLFDEIMARNEDNEHLYKHILDSEDKPFELIQGPPLVSYRIEQFYAINLNAYVNRFGDLQVDSDGDGLSDDFELASPDYDPKNPRSNGFCLDGMNEKYGCKMLGCSEYLDIDGDGLNQCEEIVMSSLEVNEDSDGDTILESHELLGEISPVSDETVQFSSGDDFSDLEHFLRGVSPYVRIASVHQKNTVQVQIEETEEYVESEDQPNFYAKAYDITLKNVPLVNTKQADGSLQFYRDSLKRKPVADIEYLLGTQHPAKVNQILLLTKVTSNEDPDLYYWLMKRLDIKYLGDGTSQNIKIDFADFIELDFNKEP